MKQPKKYQEYGKESCCPDEWNHTPCMTGNFEFDGSIQRCRNSDMRAKLEDHLAGNAYDRNTAYGFSVRD